MSIISMDHLCHFNFWLLSYIFVVRNLVWLGNKQEYQVSAQRYNCHYPKEGTLLHYWQQLACHDKRNQLRAHEETHENAIELAFVGVRSAFRKIARLADPKRTSSYTCQCRCKQVYRLDETVWVYNARHILPSFQFLSFVGRKQVTGDVNSVEARAAEDGPFCTQFLVDHNRQRTCKRKHKINDGDRSKSKISEAKIFHYLARDVLAPIEGHKHHYKSKGDQQNFENVWLCQNLRPTHFKTELN